MPTRRMTEKQNQPRNPVEMRRFDQRIQEIFPFTAPPEEILEHTYKVKNEQFWIPRLLHQTDCTTFLGESDPQNIILPAVAISQSWDLRFMGRNELPVTGTRGRQFASWWGQKVLVHERHHHESWQSRADFFLGVVQRGAFPA